MSTLDENFVDPVNVSPQPTIVRFGLIGALVLIIYSLLGNITGFTSPANGVMTAMLTGLLVFVFYIAIMVLAVRKHRDQDLGGYIPFGRAFIVSFLTSLIVGVIASAFNLLYMNVIDPTMGATIVEDAREMYENVGMSEEQIEAALKQVSRSFTTMGQIMGLGFGTIMGAVLSLIIAAILRKDPPEITA